MHWISNRLVSQTGLHTRSWIEKELKIPHNLSQAESSQAESIQAEPSWMFGKGLKEVWSRYMGGKGTNRQKVRRIRRKVVSRTRQGFGELKM